MNSLLSIFILIPLLGWLLSLIPENNQEKRIYGITLFTLIVQGASTLVFASMAVISRALPLFDNGISVYSDGQTNFTLSFYFDINTIVYGSVSSMITFFVTIFSRFYLHREKGYKRFFNNLLFFYLGLNIIIFAGNFETLFIGWEVIGITSFFLIAFYNDRYLPVKNSLKVISLYRLADILFLIGIWACHHVFSSSINFQTMHRLEVHHLEIIHSTHFQLLIPALFLVVALVKSAQVPFSSWLPRAMEGPTTSSAIFYGSLSVHMGVFLLIRTYPFWQDNSLFTAIVIFLGLLTVVVATTTARVQPTVKTQIAYSSIAQIGIMFVEVALGWHTLALIHFASNAFLRTFQLLVSPSVLHYLIHDQFYNFNPPQSARSNTFWDKIKLTFFTLSIKEWNLDYMLYRFLWNPIKKMGQLLGFMKTTTIFYLFIPLFFVGLYGVYHQALIPSYILTRLAEGFALLGILLVTKAFVERKSALTSWFLVLLNQLFTSISIGFNEKFDYSQVHIFLSGILLSGIIGYLCLSRLKKAGEDISLNRFHGHVYEHSRLTNVFMLACLGLAGFPITPTFIGEELMLEHIHEQQLVLTIMTAFNLVLNGLVVFRIYARVFLGAHEKTYHETAYRSS